MRYCGASTRGAAVRHGLRATAVVSSGLPARQPETTPVGVHNSALDSSRVLAPPRASRTSCGLPSNAATASTYCSSLRFHVHPVQELRPWLAAFKRGAGCVGGGAIASRPEGEFHACAWPHRDERAAVIGHDGVGRRGKHLVEGKEERGGRLVAIPLERAHCRVELGEVEPQRGRRRVDDRLSACNRAAAARGTSRTQVWYGNMQRKSHAGRTTLCGGTG